MRMRAEREQRGGGRSDHDRSGPCERRGLGASDHRHTEDLLDSPVGRPLGQTLMCALGVQQECPIVTLLPAPS